MLEGWAARNYCYSSCHIHSKKDHDGKQKNYGLNRIHGHVKVCRLKLKAIININQELTSEVDSSAIQPKLSSYQKVFMDKY